MRISDRGLELVKEFEGCRLTAYVCAGGKLTIGWGSTGPHVQPGKTISQAEADALLVRDLDRFERGVAGLVTVPLSQGEFDALVSFAFNLGVRKLSTSTLLRKLNAGDRAGAAAEFKRWNRAGGRVLAGLVRRRAAEAALFLSA